MATLAYLGDGDLAPGLARVGAESLNLLDDVHSRLDLAEHDVLAVEPRGDHGGDKELGAISVGSSVGRGQKSGARVLDLEVLIGELLSVDGLATSAVVAGEVTTLKHEVGDHAVESGAFVTVAAKGKQM